MAKQNITSDFYYNRTMDPVIYNQFKEGGQYHWMIQNVKDHPELDISKQEAIKTTLGSPFTAEQVKS